MQISVLWVGSSMLLNGGTEPGYWRKCLIGAVLTCQIIFYFWIKGGKRGLNIGRNLKLNIKRGYSEGHVYQMHLQKAQFVIMLWREEKGQSSFPEHICLVKHVIESNMCFQHKMQSKYKEEAVST